MSRSKNGYMSKEAHITWQKRLHEKGWRLQIGRQSMAGQGSRRHRVHFHTGMDAAGAHFIPFGLSMAPVIMAFGSDEQKQRFLPDIQLPMSGGVRAIPGVSARIWLLLQMKAEDKGDHYLCNGSKIWTSMAQHADWIFCLYARPKRKNVGKVSRSCSSKWTRRALRLLHW